MDGLEVNEFLYSKVIQSNKIHRLDSEYYSKIAMKIEEKVLSIPHFFLPHHRVISGPFGSTLKSSVYLEYGDIPFIRIENIKGGFHISRENLVYISNSDNGKIAKSQLQEDDIILSKVGNSIGYFARVDTELHTCNISENNIGIKLFDYPIEVKHTILTYLNSEYGKSLILRRKSGNAQPKLNIDDICSIPIPNFSSTFCSMISSLILESDRCIQKATSIYQNTESLLLSALNYQPIVQTQGYSENFFSTSFGKTGRLDAEYYQPKYDQLFMILAAFTTNSLGGPNGIADFRKSIEPGSESYGEEGIPFVRISDITKFGISAPDIKLPQDIVEHPEALFPKKDSILFSKDGSVGIAYKLEEDAQFITSSALLQLTVKDIEKVLPDYLTLVLNSPVVQLQAERATSGAVIQHWKPSEIEQVIIPILNMAEQKKLSQMVQDSFFFRRQAEKLLEYAKWAVELAIDQGEDKAIRWLKKHSEI